MRVLAATLAVVAIAAAPAAAATLEAPPSLGIGDTFAVVGHDLERGEGYELTLGAPPLRGSPSTCGARIGGPREVAGSRTVFSGRVPRYVACKLPDGTRVGRGRVRPGRGFTLTVCVPTTGVLCDAFSARRVRILRAGRACREFAFGENSEDVATRIRAAGGGCRTARAVASGSRRVAAGCFAPRLLLLPGGGLPLPRHGGQGGAAEGDLPLHTPWGPGDLRQDLTQCSPHRFGSIHGGASAAGRQAK